MMNRAISRKSFRLAGLAAAVGVTAALVVLGAPADAATVNSEALSAVFHLRSRGI